MSDEFTRRCTEITPPADWNPPTPRVTEMEVTTPPNWQRETEPTVYVCSFTYTDAPNRRGALAEEAADELTRKPDVTIRCCPKP